MIGLWLFARTRRTVTAVLLLLSLGLLERIVGSASLQLSDNSSLSVPWAVVVPLLAATVIGTSTSSRAAQWELTSARHQAVLRLGHATALFLLAAAATAWGSDPLTGPVTTPAALRNLAGFTGLALIAAIAVGGNLAWTLPVVVALWPPSPQAAPKENHAPGPGQSTTTATHEPSSSSCSY